MLAVWILLGILACLLVLDVAVAVVLIRFALVRNQAQAGDPQPDGSPAWQTYYDAAEAGKAFILSKGPETVSIRSFDGLTLCGTLLPADAPTARTILCVHGYRANGTFDFGAIAQFLHGLGWNLLMVDDRAHGRSGGRFLGFGVLDRRDCLSWCEYLENRYGDGCRILLYGVSMGSATVLSASGDAALPDAVCGVIGDCGYASAWDEIALQLKHMFRLPPFPVLYTANLMLRVFAGYSLRDCPPKDMIRRTRVPLLLIHGTADKFVPTDMSRQIYDNATCEKTLLLVDGAVHAHSYLSDTPAYEAAVRALIGRLPA